MIRPRNPWAQQPGLPIGQPEVTPAPPGQPPIQLIDKMGTTGNTKADWRASVQATIDAAKKLMATHELEIERLRKVIAALT